MRTSVCLTAWLSRTKNSGIGQQGPISPASRRVRWAELKGSNKLASCLPTEVVGQTREEVSCARSLPCSVRIARTGTIRRRRTRRPPLAGWSSTSFATRAASIRRTKRRSSCQFSVVSSQEKLELRTENGSLRTYRGISSTVKLSVSKTELLGSNPSSPARHSEQEPDAGKPQQ